MICPTRKGFVNQENKIHLRDLIALIRRHKFLTLFFFIAGFCLPFLNAPRLLKTHIQQIFLLRGLHEAAETSQILKARAYFLYNPQFLATLTEKFQTQGISKSEHYIRSVKILSEGNFIQSNDGIGSFYKFAFYVNGPDETVARSILRIWTDQSIESIQRGNEFIFKKFTPPKIILSKRDASLQIIILAFIIGIFFALLGVSIWEILTKRLF